MTLRVELLEELTDSDAERLRRARLEAIPAGYRRLSPLWRADRDDDLAPTSRRSAPCG